MRAWACAGAAVVTGLVITAAQELPGLSPYAVMVVSDLGQLFAAATASLLAFLAAGRAGARRASWLALALGVGAWAAGQTVWSYYEVVQGSEVPFPSLADIGFLVFPVAAAVGLAWWLRSQGTLVATGRDLLDGAIIACSLLVLSWVTALGSVASGSTGGWLAVVLSLAYPVGDVILATLALLALARAQAPERVVLGILAVGLGFLAVADSAYVYLVSAGEYTTADLVSSCWVFGFLLVAAAALAQLTGPGRRTDSTAAQTTAAQDADEDAAKLLPLVLPYIPVAAAGAVVLYKMLTYPGRPLVALVLCVGLVVMVLSRQFLAMAENQRLYAALACARDQLQHQALHDHLTQLPNRALFTDRLDHALRQPGVDLGLLFCDLDDFKQVNDRYGHSGGDLVLAEVARRLLSCVRAGDTVARLGGDEFAILLENAEDTQQVADRVITSMLEPFDLHGEKASVSVSLGVVQHDAGEVEGQRSVDPVRIGRRPGAVEDPGAVAHQMLREADLAMYAAKTSGKGKAVVAGEVMGGPKRT